MPIKVKGFLTYKEIVGERSIVIDKGEIYTIVDLLNFLADELDQGFSQSIYDPQTNKLAEHVAVIINGRSYTNLPKGLNTQLKDGDEVAIFPPMTGGSENLSQVGLMTKDGSNSDQHLLPC